MQTLSELCIPFCPAREGRELLLHPAPSTQHTQISSPDEPAPSLSLYCRSPTTTPLLPSSVFRKIYCLYGNYYGLMCLGRLGAVWGDRRGMVISGFSPPVADCPAGTDEAMLTVHGSVILDICTHLNPENLTIWPWLPHQKKKKKMGEFPHSSFQFILCISVFME